MMKRIILIVVVVIACLAIIGTLDEYNKIWGRVAANVFLVGLLAIIVGYFIKLRLSSANVDSASNQSGKTTAKSLSVDSDPPCDPQLKRGLWVKFVGIIYIIILVLGLPYALGLPLLTLFGFIFFGADAGYTALVLVVISFAGLVGFLISIVVSINFAFSKQYKCNFSTSCKVIMFLPLFFSLVAVVPGFYWLLPEPVGSFLSGPSPREMAIINGQKVPFSKIKAIERSRYAIYENQVYVHSCTDCAWTEYHLMQGVASSSFSIISPELARDDANVYYFGSKVDGADPDTSEMLVKGYFRKDTWRDKNHIYVGSSVVSDYPKSFQSFGLFYTSHYFSDGKKIFINNVVIPDADPKTFFTSVSYAPFSVDSTHVFCGTRIIEGADTKTFVTFVGKSNPLNKNDTVVYGKDGKYAYFCPNYSGTKIIRIEEVDVGSFDASGMEYGHAKDQYRDYYFNVNQKERPPYKFTEY